MSDFASKRLAPDEWPVIREAYSETYPVRPLLNHVDALAATLRTVRDRIYSGSIHGLCGVIDSALAAIDKPEAK